MAVEDFIKPHNRPMVKVSFINVGASDMSWSIECEEQHVNGDFLAKEINQKGALMSRGIDFRQYKENEDKHGIFVGQVRHVGDVEIKEVN